MAVDSVIVIRQTETHLARRLQLPWNNRMAWMGCRIIVGRGERDLGEDLWLCIRSVRGHGSFRFTADSPTGQG